MRGAKNNWKKIVAMAALVLTVLSLYFVLFDSKKSLAAYTAGGLVASYNFTETSGTAVADSSGAGNGATASVDGWDDNGGYVFSGTNNIASNVSSNTHGSAFSYEIWTSFSGASIAQNTRLIDDGTLAGFKIQVRDSYPSVYFNDQDWTVSQTCGTGAEACGSLVALTGTNDMLKGNGPGSAALLTNGTIYHIVLTYDNADNRTVKLYLGDNNGHQPVLVGQASASLAYQPNATKIAIGSDIGNGSVHLVGTMSRASVYNRALTATEVTDNYNAGAGYNYVQTASASASTITTSVTAKDNANPALITVTVNDANSRPIAGHTVTLTGGRDGVDTIATASADSNITSASGQATFNFSSSTLTDSPITLTATDTTNNVVLTNTCSVTVERTSYTSSGLVLSYNLNEENGIQQAVTDSSGAGNGGTFSGTRSTSAPVTWTGDALYFNGTDNYITGPANSAHGNSFTYDIWASFPSMPLPAPYSRIVDDRGASGNFKIQVVGTSAAVTFLGQTWTPTIGSTANSNTMLVGNATGGTLSSTVPNHIVVTYDNTAKRGKVYLNGTLVGDGILTSQGSYQTNSTPMVIGGDGSDSSKRTPMTLHRMSIYNRVLSQTEVTTNKDAGANYNYSRTLAPVSVSNSTVISSALSVLNNGTATATITVTAKDENNYLLPGKSVTLVSDRGDADTITVGSSTTDDNGRATFSIASAETGLATLTATIDDLEIANQAEVTFTDISAAASTIVAQHHIIPSDGVTTTNIIVTALGAGGSSDPLSGRTVTLTNSGDSSTTITAVSPTTNASGKAVFAVKSNKGSAYDSTYGATIDGVAINATVKINYKLANMAADYNVPYTTNSTFDGYTLTFDAAYDKSETNLPVMLVLSGYTSTFDTSYLNQLAGKGIFAIRTLKRGCTLAENQDTTMSCTNPPSIHPDDSGRETQDFIDALEFVKTHYSQYVDPNNINVMGFSGGGGNTYSLITRFPDYFRSANIFYGMNDYGYGAETSWWMMGKGAVGGNQTSDYSSAMAQRIGCDRTTCSNKYWARDFLLGVKNNPYTHIQLFHDYEDSVVSVNQTLNYAAKSLEERHDNVVANIANAPAGDYGDNVVLSEEDGWHHNAVDTGTDDYFVSDITGGLYPIPSLDETAEMFVPGYVDTKQFRIELGDGEDAVANLTYDISGDGLSLDAAKTFQVEELTGSAPIKLSVKGLRPSTTYFLVDQSNDSSSVVSTSTDSQGKFTKTLTLDGAHLYKLYTDITPPTLTLTSLPELTLSTTASSLTLSGSVTDSGSGLDAFTINGVSISNPSNFSATVNLNMGLNTITIVATDIAGNTTTKTLSVTRNAVSGSGGNDTNSIVAVVQAASGNLVATPAVVDNNAASSITDNGGQTPQVSTPVKDEQSDSKNESSFPVWYVVVPLIGLVGYFGLSRYIKK